MLHITRDPSLNNVPTLSPFGENLASAKWQPYWALSVRYLIKVYAVADHKVTVSGERVRYDLAK